jgi:hypothetical protein
MDSRSGFGAKRMGGVDCRVGCCCIVDPLVQSSGVM